MIALLEGHRNLKNFLKSVHQNPSLKRKYWTLADISLNEESMLHRHGFVRVYSPSLSQEEKDFFLKEYIAFVAKISAQVHSKLWWASNFSARNIFASKLTVYLQEFVEALGFIKECSDGYLIIFNPSRFALPSIEKFLRKENIRYVCYCCRFKMAYSRCLLIFRKFLSLIFDAIVIGLRIIYVQWQLKANILKNLGIRQSCYVVKTFVYNHSFLRSGQYCDAFFGSLPQYLKDKKNVVILANILGNFRFCVQKIKEQKEFVIIPLEIFISLGDVFRGVLQMLLYRVKFPEILCFKGEDVADIVRKELSRNFYGIQLYQLLHYDGTKKFLKDVSIDTFLLTYENNPWEKMCMMACRETAPRVRLLGYQHCVIPHAAPNMFMGSMERDIMPQPDVILTVGDEPKKIIEEYGTLKDGKIRTSCALRYEYLFSTITNPRRHERHILLGLEGILEVYKMVNYVAKELKNNHEFKVAIRPHPVLPFKKFAHKLDFSLKSLPHFSLSQETSIEEDIKKADLMIYWGSTVSLEALWAGKPLIHFDTGSALTYDPLFKCYYLKWVVTRRDSLLKVIDEIRNLTEEEFEEQRVKAKAYLKKYFLPNRKENLEKFLNPFSD